MEPSLPCSVQEWDVLKNNITQALERYCGNTCSFEFLTSLFLRLGNTDGSIRSVLDQLRKIASDEKVSCRQFVDFIFEGEENSSTATLRRIQAEMSRFLGVSVKHISTTLFEEMTTAGLTREANFHDIEPKVVLPKGVELICPRDGEVGTSYVDSLRGEDQVGRATFMLSYTWSYAIGDVADALQAYCHREQLDQSRTYFWICCFCINQHRVRLGRRKNITVPFEQFKHEFGDRVREIGHVVAMMDPWDKPTYIQRVWCTFEMYCAISGGVSITVIMPPRESSRLNSALLEPTGLDHVWRALVDLKIENANASVPEDRDRIFDLIQQGPGFQDLNSIVRKRLQRWIIDSSEHHAHACMNIDSGSVNGNSVWRLCAKVGSLMREIGLLSRSSGLLEQALRAYESSGMAESSESAYLLRQWGIMKFDYGDFDAAEKAFSLVHSTYNRLQILQTPNGALLLVSIGAVKAAHGDHRGALEVFAEAESIIRSTGVFETMIGAILLRHVGASKTQLGELDSAMESFEKAQKIHTDTHTENSPMGAILQRHIAEAKRLNGDYSCAIKVLHRAKNICAISGTLETLEGMKLMLDLGDVRAGDQESNGSLDCYIEAQRIAKLIGIDHSGSVDDKRLQSRLDSIR